MSVVDGDREYDLGMKLYTIVRVDMNEHEILKQPGVLARLRRALGGDPDLTTGKMRAALEAAMLIDAHRRALAEVGASDAVALVVDDLVLFEDRDRRPDDLGDLFLAFHEYAPALATDFRLLRLTVEHVEAGIHYVIELQARTEYPKGEAAVRVIVSGRLAELQPRAGETAEQYRLRVEPVVRDRVGFQVAQASFDSFVARLRDAIARALPDATATVVVPESATVLPARKRDPRPDDRDYDPHESYYPNPMLGMAMLGFAMMPGWFAGMPAASDPSDTPDTPEMPDSPDDAGGFDFEW